MAALDKYLITKTDILTYQPTAVLDDNRINPIILETQRQDLRPVLNDALYFDFLTNFDDDEHAIYDLYQDLLNGVEYTHNTHTIQFDGVKPMLVCFALSRFVSRNPVNITRMGVVIKTNDQSQPADSGQIKVMVNELRSVAISYQNQVIQYLETQVADYPLYNTGGASSNKGNNTSFKFSRL